MTDENVYKKLESIAKDFGGDISSNSKASTYTDKKGKALPKDVPARKKKPNFKHQTYKFRRCLFYFGLILVFALSACSTYLVIAWFKNGVDGKIEMLPSNVAIAFIAGLSVESIAIIHIIAKSIFPKDDKYSDECEDEDDQGEKE